MFHDAMFLRKARAGGAAIPVRVGVGSWGAGTAAGGISPTRPSGVVNGDFLVTIVWSNSATAVVTPPSGWTKVFGNIGAGDPFGADVYVKTASGEPSSYTWSATAGTLYACVLAYRGGANAVDVIGAHTLTASSTVSTAAGFTAANDGVLIAFFCLGAQSRTVTTAPSGMTQISLHVPSGASRAIYDMTPSAAGAVATRTLTWSGAANNAAGIALQIR